MRLGVVILPELPAVEARAAWARAEQLGFAHGWTYDHLAWRNLHTEPWYGAVPFLAAAALATTTMELGTLVASPNFRHPVPFARDLITLDELSGGRFTLGIGAGGTGWDATVLGQEPWTPTERADRFAEFVDLTDQLLRSPVTTSHGRYYSAVDAAMVPGCVQRPRLPFAVAATGPRGMRLAARQGQAWVTTGAGDADPPLTGAQGAAMVAGQLARLEQACAAEGRDPADLRRIVLTGLELDPGTGSPEQLRDTMGHYEEAGVTDLVLHRPRANQPYQGDVGHFEDVVAAVLA